VAITSTPAAAPSRFPVCIRPPIGRFLAKALWLGKSRKVDLRYTWGTGSARIPNVGVTNETLPITGRTMMRKTIPAAAIFMCYDRLLLCNLSRVPLCSAVFTAEQQPSSQRQ
jgi:hypothetical protein